MLTEDTSRLIASLRSDRAYNALLNHLDEEVAGMLTELAGAETPSAIMRLTRLWQVALRLSQVMRSAPEALSETFAAMKDQPTLELNSWGMEDDEDHFINRPRTLPPTSQSANYSPIAKIDSEA